MFTPRDGNYRSRQYGNLRFRQFLPIKKSSGTRRALNSGAYQSGLEHYLKEVKPWVSNRMQESRTEMGSP